MKQLWSDNAKLAAAVSGGVDSMVLIDLLRRSGSFHSLTLLHVNHGLRSQSDEEEHMVKAYAERWQLPLFIKHLSQTDFDLSKSIQAPARQMRYDFFKAMMKQHELDMLLTAHHQDDQLENIMFRLMTHRFKMEPLKIQQEIDRGMKIGRPLLNMTKAELYDYAAEHNVPFMEDDSNQSMKYKRNIIRHNVLPVMVKAEPHVKDSLLALADWHSDVMELLDYHVQMLDDLMEGNRLSIRLFNAAPVIVRRHFLLRHTVNQPAVTSAYLDEIIRVLTAADRTIHYPLGDCILEYAYGELYFHKPCHHDDQLIITSPGKYSFNEYFIECSEVIVPLTVRLPALHDKIELKDRTLKLNRFFINKKIPLWERRRMPVIVSSGNIIAVGDYLKNPCAEHINLTMKRIKENDHA